MPLRLAPDCDSRRDGDLLQELPPRHQLRRTQPRQDQGPRLFPGAGRIVQPGPGTRGCKLNKVNFMFHLLILQ